MPATANTIRGEHVDVAVTGSSGFIGSALVAALEREGHRVVALVRSGPSRPNTIRWDPDAGAIDAAGLEDIDAVVHLAGESIGAARWTAAKKARILTSRTRGTRLLAETLAGLKQPPGVLVSASAVGFYGSRGDQILTEDSAGGTGFLADVVRQWEAAAQPAAEAGIRVVNTRSGVVFGAGGGALPLIALPFRFGLGGRLGSGRHWMSWISLSDEVGAIVRLLRDPGPVGPVNVTSPNPVPNATFTRILANVLRRPAPMIVPTAALKAVFGSEVVDDFVLASQRVKPARLIDAGYEFQAPDLEPALRRALGKPG
jgi:uncharacterized protein